MLYAMSEIVFFLLLAVLLGAAAGWWLARSGKISVSAAMKRSGAHAAAERELETARAEITQLTTKLAIATEAIRELEAEGVTIPVVDADDIAPLPETPPPPVELRAVGDGEESGEVESETSGSGVEAAGFEGAAVDEDEAVLEDEAPTGDEGAADPGSDEAIVRSVRSKGGKRLSDRVAEASVLSRDERAAPKIEFGDSSD